MNKSLANQASELVKIVIQHEARLVKPSESNPEIRTHEEVMADLQTIQQAMSELGPYDDRIGLIEEVGGDRWLVVYDDDTAVEIECDEPGNKLTFMMTVGAVPQDNRLELYEGLLAYNYLHHESGGMRMAIDGPDGNVILLVDLCLLDLDAGVIAGFLDIVLETGLGWREALGGPVPVGAGETDAGGEDLSGAIQA